MHLLIFYWSKLRTFAPNIIKSKKKNKFFYYLFKNKCSKYCTSKTGSMAKEIRNREDNYSEWYNNLVIKADLAENSAVRGCMVIKPYGYAIWEKMQADLDRRFKETGHVNAY